MSKLNRLSNAHNEYQGQIKKVLCVCSAGLLRSPTAAVVLSQPPFNFNTRAVGLSSEYALIPLEDVHIYWADEIVVMEPIMEERLNILITENGWFNHAPKVFCLNIQDDYPYRDPKLMELIAQKYKEVAGYESHD